MLDVPRLPGAGLLVFGVGQRPLVPAALDGLLDLARPRAADVAQQQTEGAPDGVAGAVGLAECVEPGVDAQPLAHGAVDHHHRGCAGGGGDQPVEGVAHALTRIERRFNGGQHQREVLGRAARHHGVDRDLLDRAVGVVGRDFGDLLLRVAVYCGQHRSHALGRGRNDGQAVGQPLLKEEFVDIDVVGDVQYAGRQSVSQPVGRGAAH